MATQQAHERASTLQRPNPATPETRARMSTTDAQSTSKAKHKPGILRNDTRKWSMVEEMSTLHLEDVIIKLESRSNSRLTNLQEGNSSDDHESQDDSSSVLMPSDDEVEQMLPRDKSQQYVTQAMLEATLQKYLGSPGNKPTRKGYKARESLGKSKVKQLREKEKEDESREERNAALVSIAPSQMVAS